MKRLFVRPELCTGCKTCVLACAVEHSRARNLLGAMLEAPPPQPRLYVEAQPGELFEMFKLPLTCRHCDPAPCMAACLPGAMYRTAECVVTNVGGKHTCIACGMCIMMCPFGMITRAASPSGKLMALKCDLCPGRSTPACAESCPTGAIVFLEAADFAQTTRLRTGAALAQARSLRETTLTTALEE